MSEAVRRKMTADEFIAWAMERPEGEHYELTVGQVVAMAPETVGHNLLKTAITRKLAEAIEGAGNGCTVLADGISLRVDESTIYEPDVMVRCGSPLAMEAVEINDPLIVVEVLSRSTRGVDRGRKLRDYFRLESLRHYLMADYETKVVTHHRRGPNGAITMTIIGNGEIRLDPPGITIRDLFAGF